MEFIIGNDIEIFHALTLISKSLNRRSSFELDCINNSCSWIAIQTLNFRFNAILNMFLWLDLGQNRVILMISLNLEWLDAIDFLFHLVIIFYFNIFIVWQLLCVLWSFIKSLHGFNLSLGMKFIFIVKIEGSKSSHLISPFHIVYFIKVTKCWYRIKNIESLSLILMSSSELVTSGRNLVENISDLWTFELCRNQIKTSHNLIYFLF